MFLYFVLTKAAPFPGFTCWNSTIIYLKGSAATLIKRLEGSNNPTLEGTENKEEKIKKLLKQRDPVYEKFADIKVVTGVKPFDELIAEIEEKLKA